MKMEPIVSSETSAIRTQTPGNYPKRNNLHLEHGESLRTDCIVNVLCQLQVKHYIVQVFIVECNFSVTIKIHSFTDTCLYEFYLRFDMKNLFSKFVQAF